MNLFHYLSMISCCLWSCSGKGTAEQQSPEEPSFLGYHLRQPSEVYELPEELEEVSGMAALAPDYLLLNEDESGTLYFFQLERAEVEKEIEWGDDGDYEGLTVVGNTAYVAESNGTLYRIGDYMNEDPEVDVFEHESLEDCDVEGLHYLEEENTLLLACKEGSGERKIYSFSLADNSLQSRPYRTLALKEVEEKLISDGIDRISLDIRKMLDPEEESGILYPSGIAKHPKTKDLYVLSAETKLLIVYDKAGALKEVVELRNELFYQPEAIAFAPNGDLFVGNEGKGGEPNILKFEYVQE